MSVCLVVVMSSTTSVCVYISNTFDHVFVSSSNAFGPRLSVCARLCVCYGRSSNAFGHACLSILVMHSTMSVCLVVAMRSATYVNVSILVMHSITSVFLVVMRSVHVFVSVRVRVSVVTAVVMRSTTPVCLCGPVEPMQNRL